MDILPDDERHAGLGLAEVADRVPARGAVSGGDTTPVGYRVHAIRFYDRQLTESEIRRNARQDGFRYFGVPEPGLTIIVH